MKVIFQLENHVTKTAAAVSGTVTEQWWHPSVAALKDSIVHHLRCTIGTSELKASKLAWWQAVVAAVNELIFERLTQTQFTHAQKDTRAINYLSAEFLMGRLTVNNLCKLISMKSAMKSRIWL